MVKYTRFDGIPLSKLSREWTSYGLIQLKYMGLVIENLLFYEFALMEILQ